MKTTYTSKVFSDEIEDRLDAPFYQEECIELLRRLKKKGIKIVKLEELIHKMDRDPNFYNIEYTPSGVDVIRGIDIHVPFVDFTYTEKIALKTHQKFKKTEVYPKDLIMTVRGSVGRIGQIPNTVKFANISPNVIFIRLKDKSYVEFVNILLSSSFGRNQIKRISVKSIQETVTEPYIERLPIPIVPKTIEEVRGVVSQAEALYIESNRKIERARKIFINAIGINTNKIKEEKEYRIFSSDLGDVFIPKFYYPRYLNTLKAIKKKFDILRLEEIAEINEGDEVGSKNYRTQFNKDDDDVPFIRTSDIVNYEIDNYPDYYISSEIYRKLSQDLGPTDILFTKDGKIGLAAMITKSDKCIIASGIVRLRIKKEYRKTLDPYYVFLVLSTEIGLYQALQRTVTAATIPHLKSPERLGEIEIPIILDDKRKEVSNLVKEAFELKEEKRNLIKKAKKTTEKIIEDK